MKTLNLLLFLTFLTFLFVVAFGCDDTVSNYVEDIPESNVSYSKHIQPIFNLKCTSSGCHEDQTRAGNLSLTSYGNVTADELIIVPYHPENSILVWAIEGDAGYGPMPPLGAPVPPLSQKEIQGIKTWIKEGAKSN